MTDTSTPTRFEIKRERERERERDASDRGYMDGRRRWFADWSSGGGGSKLRQPM
ncbi:hypothetical protein Hanom_Chr16g01452481 [Helianthus anomalus]